MKSYILLLILVSTLYSCSKDKEIDVEPTFISEFNNPEIFIETPKYFPLLNGFFLKNKPTKYGVQLGEKLFNDKRLSSNNSISCASCHIQENAFTDKKTKAIGILGRVGLRNTPPIQNLAFMNFYMWDGNELELEHQPIVPIITKEEMGSSILEIITKIQGDKEYQELFKKTYGEDKITQEKIFKSIAQYEYTLVTSNSKYDQVMKKDQDFTPNEKKGYETFKQKCANCHATELFTDQSFRNIGFPINPDKDEVGRARVTGKKEDIQAFRVPSLRNIQYTAPYGSFGQFASLKEVLDYFDKGVLDADNLDPILKKKNNKIALTEEEKTNLIHFMNTLSDPTFVKK
ncbi:cytochrome-c peroxidase [Flavobacterium columnare]|uniref:cytochrome-c peroxidase n=1 Tax=Flavobacterium columnare TaxID=996 RepID=UPI000D1B57D7|nr:cytochrome-c peroxidase [Flavobacterium columnare]PTD16511.1 cytochrome-c peroxidase [Flavobacterium columnare]